MQKSLCRLGLALLLGVSNHNMTAIGPGDCAVHEDHVVRDIDAHDLEIADRHPLVPPAAGHSLPLLDLAAIAAIATVRANAAARPVMPLHAVAGSQPVEIVLLHHARR